MRVIFLSLLFVPFLVSSQELVSIHEQLPKWDDLLSSWNMIYPEQETQCLYGTPYAFFVKPGKAQDVFISFPGGGACWSGLTCSNEPTGRLDMGPKTISLDDLPSDGGIFSDLPTNPFNDFTHIHIGYCTGDMHMGNNTVINDSPLPENQNYPELHFNGYNNTKTVIDWLLEQNHSIERLVVGGFTSGSYGTPIYVHILSELLPNADVFHIGDGIGAIHLGKKVQPLLEAWGIDTILDQYPEMESELPSPYEFNDLIVAAGNLHPEVTLTQIISSNDRVFSELIDYLGSGSSMSEVIRSSQTYINSRITNFRSFTLGGDAHVLGLGHLFSVENPGNSNMGLPMIYDRFFSMGIDGISYSQWVSDLIESKLINSMSCVNCEKTEVIPINRINFNIDR
jgi:hypothetical protein